MQGIQENNNNDSTTAPAKEKTRHLVFSKRIRKETFFFMQRKREKLLCEILPQENETPIRLAVSLSFRNTRTRMFTC
jgi:hypothetical protein